MTDLLSRPARTGHGATTASGHPVRRSLTTAGLVAGATAATVTLVVCMAVAVTGWFLADAGAHGDTTDALRVGADAWLLGHGSGLTFSGVPLGMLPLGLTAILLLTAFRTGRAAGQRSDLDGDPGRSLAAATGTYVLAYGVLVVLTWVLAATTAAAPSLGRALLGTVLVGVLGGAPGLAVGSGILHAVLPRVPTWLRTTLYGAAAGALVLVAAAALLVAVSLALHLNEAATVISRLHLSVGDAVALTVVTALVAPNCVLLAVAYLVGPGFAVGTGTVVSPTVVSLGALPAFPALAALPAEGDAPGWAVAFMAVPALAGVLGGILAQRGDDGRAFDLAALRGAVAGVGAAVIVGVAVALADGPLGDGRMADIGAPFFEVLVIACGGMGVGGMLGALATAWWQRRR